MKVPRRDIVSNAINIADRDTEWLKCFPGADDLNLKLPGAVVRYVAGVNQMLARADAAPHKRSKNFSGLRRNVENLANPHHFIIIRHDIGKPELQFINVGDELGAAGRLDIDLGAHVHLRLLSDRRVSVIEEAFQDGYGGLAGLDLAEAEGAPRMLNPTYSAWTRQFGEPNTNPGKPASPLPRLYSPNSVDLVCIRQNGVFPKTGVWLGIDADNLVPDLPVQIAAHDDTPLTMMF